MSVLSDEDVKTLIKDKKLGISGYPEIQEASIDIHIGKNIRKLIKRRISTGEVTESEPFSEQVKTEAVTLRLGDTIIADTKEKFRLPCDLVGLIVPRFKFSAIGLRVHGMIHPGSQGEQYMVITNLGPMEIVLHKGDSVCQVVFFETKTPSNKAYGKVKNIFSGKPLSVDFLTP